jgi:16S rRNA (adenine1518-N6/adenine1519-N6)-dimethyltransferase
MRYSKKSLGQNFLKDLNIIKKIVSLSKITNNDIVEIGPGRGALTDQILKKKPKSLTLIEKDNLLSYELKLKYKNNKIVKIFNDDILEFDLEKKIKKNTVIFGNLPYNISSQILVKIVRFKKWPPNYSSIIFMFQKEMADRIVGKFGTKKYGRLSILTNYKLDILNSFDVSPNCFIPAPKVNSTILFFKPKKQLFNIIKNINNLEKVTNILFSNRRKMINKNIKKIFKETKFLNLIKNLDLKSRPSDLNPEMYYNIAKIFEEIS